MTTAVRPDRPPAAIPAALSIYVVTVEVPAMAPAMVDAPSTPSMCPRRGTRPSLSSRPAFLITPTIVPSESKRSTNTMARIRSARSQASTPFKSSWRTASSASPSCWASDPGQAEGNGHDSSRPNADQKRGSDPPRKQRGSE